MADQIYVVEDHSVMRQGYAAIVDRESDLEICGETGSAARARQEIPEMEPDLAIIDLSLEEGNGLDLIKDLRAQSDHPKILVVSMHDEALYAHRTLQAGAEGYLAKHESAKKVVDAIRQLLGGGMYFSEAVNEQMVLQYLTNDTDGGDLLSELSDRELEVFEYIGRGLTTREIAEELQLSPKTIGTYRGRIKEKLAVESNARLRRRAVIWVEVAEV